VTAADAAGRLDQQHVGAEIRQQFAGVQAERIA